MFEARHAIDRSQGAVTMKTLALGVAVLLGAAAWTAPAATPVPYRIQGSDPIACAGTPFGRRMPIGIDHEALVLRRQTNGAAGSYQLSGTPLAFQRQNPLDGVLAGSNRIASASVDLNGDGLDELVVVAGKANGSFGVRVVRRNPVDGSLNDQFGSYEWTSIAPATAILDLAVAAADLDGSTDGREEVVIATRYNQNILRVIALSGDANGNIAQASNTAMAQWTLPANEYFSTNTMRMATGDVLLEGRDQVVVMALRDNGGIQRAYTILRAAGTATGANPAMTFTHQTFAESRSGNGVARMYLHIADTGGSSARELVIHDQDLQAKDSTPSNTQQLLRYFTTTRNAGNQITGVALGPTSGLNHTIDTTGRAFVAAVGELDRRPDAEILVSHELNGVNTLRTQVYKVGYNVSGFPVSIGPVAPAVLVDIPLIVSGAGNRQLDLAIGDADGDAIGDAYLAVRDQLSNGNSTYVTKLRRYAMQHPADPNAFPTPTSFALAASFDFPTSFADSSDILVRVADWDRDSVLADLGLTCRRVREPVIRSVVNLPPYWDRLQGNSSGFLATIGKTRTAGSTTEQRYDTFSSHDISGYVGVSVGGDFFGIGAKVSAKVTAGTNYESRRGELRGSEITTTTGESQQQDQGEGLVVVEENTYDCYDYDVVQNATAAAASNLRACELIRRNTNGDQLRSFTATDLETWDTVTAAGSGVGGTPTQWAPLRPDWSSIALFRPVALGFTPTAGTTAANAVDGRFSTVLTSGTVSQPYLQLDLGAVRDVTSIRVFPQAGQAGAFAGFNIYASESSLAGSSPPTGPAVRVFAPDAQTGNGLDRWNVWTRDPANGNAPMRARYVRIQHPGNSASLRIAEVQVFGDVHKEPPAYPQSVCDPVANDGIFLARVADLVSGAPAYRNVEVRGNLQWTGAPTDAQCGSNHAGVVQTSIWGGVTVGGSGINAWDLNDSVTNVTGTSTSISHSVRVGGELEAEAGVVVGVVAGGAYEYSSGVTEENSSTMYWGTGLMYAGAVGGFQAGSNQDCEYRPQPFSYKASERSNVGYEHQFTVIDYVVRDFTWSRLGPNLPPQDCYPPLGDSIFGNGFEN